MGDIHMKGTKKRAFPGIMCGLFLGLFLLSLWGGCQPAEKPSVEITEVVSSNGQSYVREGYGALDWIELHNASARPVSLNGWILTDKYDSLDADCSLPNITLRPDGYCVIFADKEMSGTGSICLPFGLSKSGETLYLFNASGEQMDQLSVPALEKDVSWAKRPDGTFGYCLAPTPCEANDLDILTEFPPALVKEEPSLERLSSVPIRINEICSVPDAGEPDWIELYNPSDREVDLRGFFLSDSISNAKKGVLPRLTIPAQGYLVIPLGEGADAQTGLTGFSIASTGESVYLFDRELSLIDSVEVPALREGLVYALRDDGTFGYCGVPTPGAANGSGIYEYSLRTMAADSPIHISEGLYRNRYSAIDAYGDRSDWVELVNRSDSACSLQGYCLSDDRNDLTKWPLPDVTLAPGEYMLVFLSGRVSTEKELHAPFSVSSKNEGCFLYDRAKLEMELLPCPKDLPENVSLGLGEDGQLIYFGYPTPGSANAQSFSGPLPASIFPSGAILISEVSAGGDDGDWVELYNRSNKAVTLNGWHLSDDVDKLAKKSLDQLSVDPGAYTVVRLDKKGDGTLFSIALSGEELVLSDNKGAVRDVFASGALQKGNTSGRVEQSPETGRVFFRSPTPGKRNDSHLMQGYAGRPRFSDTTLYHDAPFTLTLEADSGTVIRYTLDGSAPTSRSPVYSGPLTITKNTTVRAVGMAADRFPSEEIAATYLFRTPHTLPVVCLAADPGKWTRLTLAPKQVEGLQEQLAYINYYEADGTLGTAFPAGISPRGNASLGYPQKSLSVHLRSDYGQNAVTYPFWGEKSFLSYKFLVLRNGSQDIRTARLRDSFANRAAENLRVMTVWTRPVIVYVNGEYYGIMDLNEGMNHDYLWTHYGVDGDTVNIVQRNNYVKRGSAAGFVALRNFAEKRNMTNDKVYEEFCQMMDMDAFIDYIIAQSFFGNYDIHNQNWWNAGDQILWQPFLYDVDRCLNISGSNVLGLYFKPEGIVHNKLGDRIMMEIPCGLKKNAAWRQRFLDRFAQVLCTEFSEERLLALLDEMADTLRPEMKEHIARWDMPGSMKDWETNIRRLRRNITNRHAEITRHIQSQFSLTNAKWKEYLDKYQEQK